MNWPLATDPLGWLGVLVFIIVVSLFLGVFIAATLGPIAFVIAMIVKLLRSSSGNNTAAASGGQVLVSGPGASFAQAFGAALQQNLGQQLGQQLGQVLAQAAAQYPLTLQLAPTVMAIDAARRQGDLTPVRRFLTGRFAESAGVAAGTAPALDGISRMTVVGDEAATHADHAVIRITRAGGLANHEEYWSFQRDSAAPPDGTPTQCPHCGAPTAGDMSGACRFCGFSFFTSGPALPAPPRWLLDAISDAPPALAA